MAQIDSLHAEDAALPAVESPNQEATNASVVKASGILAFGNIASRVLGMARDIAITTLFGASRATDAFYVATLVPKTLYDVMIGGQLNGAIIPVLSEVVTKEGQKALWQVLSILLSLVTVVLSALVLIILIFAPQIVTLVGGGYDAPTQALAADLLRLTSPALLFLSLFAVLSGTLYAMRSFTLPAMAGALFNGCIVLGTILLAPPLQVVTIVSATSVQWIAARPIDGIRAAVLGWLIGAFVQMISQIPGLRAARVHFTLNWRHPALIKIGKLYIPIMFSLIIDAALRFLSFNFASQTGNNSLSYMNWATTLIQFPQGLVATAISIAILPTLARQSVLARAGERPFKDTLGLGLRLAIMLIIPAAVGLFVLALPIVSLIFEHGAFTSADSVITSLALRYYLLGLPFAAVDLLLVYAFYARQDTLTPALIGLVSLVAYTIVALVLLPTFGLFALMLADSAKQLTHCVLSAIILSRRMNGFGDQRLPLTIGKSILAAGVMGALGLVTLPIFERVIGTDGLIRQIVLVGVAGGLGLIVFMALAALLRLEELRWLAGLIRQRFVRE
ncbi:MAG TPA: murein biosynthesis integral membrane protein MurJ [Phototrophicaceae bacterium]|nr:murein biosynthesis integral membrane protein MurJ [Phototrophicaceae bacterium]